MPTESEMTVENFCSSARVSQPAMVARDSKASTYSQSAQWNSSRQLALEPVKEKARLPAKKETGVSPF